MLRKRKLLSHPLWYKRLRQSALSRSQPTFQVLLLEDTLCPARYKEGWNSGVFHRGEVWKWGKMGFLWSGLIGVGSDAMVGLRVEG